MGVITIKKIAPITIGGITFSSKVPNFIQTKFRGVSNLELISPKTKNINDIINNQSLIGC